ncbi:MAG: CapA family protein [Parcubacteria group bacterium]|nr:CapA family protein [Parcubacteria group bacterium]
MNIVAFLTLLFALSAVGGGALRYTEDYFSETFSSETSATLQSAQVFEQYVKILSAARAARESKSATIVFVGDVMLSRGIERVVLKHGGGDWRYPFLRVADELHAADLAFGNLEGPISARGRNQGSMYSFRADPRSIEGLVFAGLDVMSLANNHIFDWGPDALVDTINILGANGVAPIGAGRNFIEANAPAIFEIGGARVAFFAYTNLYPKSLEASANRSGVSSFDLKRIGEAIQKLKESGEADLVVVSLHWGDEYKPKASKEQIAIGHKLVDSGADVVVGHHPHVIQEIEEYRPSTSSGPPGRAGWIAYSLGNFLFDQNFDEYTQKGLLLKVFVENKGIFAVETSTVAFSQTFQPLLGP